LGVIEKGDKKEEEKKKKKKKGGFRPLHFYIT
jgi:hypothetical protein